MKYGNLKAGAINFDADKAAAKDLLDKGELSQEKYDKLVAGWKKVELSYIVATNGGGYIPKKERKGLASRRSRMRDKKQTYSEQKEQFKSSRTVSNKDDLLKEANEQENTQ